MKRLKLKPYQRMILVLILLIFVPKIYFTLSTFKQIYPHNSLNQISPSPVALVYGAGLQSAGEPSLVLADRVSAAVDLLKAKKVERLLLSGKKEPSYDEVKAMKNLATRLGVKEDQLILDEVGFRSYDSCLNARDKFHLKELTLVTQAFHLPRAVYICNKLGLKVQGLSSDISPYSFEKRIKWNIREIFACWRALWDSLI